MSLPKVNAPKILQLCPFVVKQIAAGEVIERPASVVKELIENSIDAGADRIEIDIEGGGLHLIRVRDNGHGINKVDLPLAFSLHATSKIIKLEDLSAIKSLGFRGEALASIASVSRTQLISKSIQSENAWKIQMDLLFAADLQLTSHPTGTTVEVTDLFYNTPVRRKFLRSEKTEFQAIDDLIKRLALSAPHVHFLLKHQQRQYRNYPSTSFQEETRIAKICGQQFIEHAVYVDIEGIGIHLKGWVGDPSLAKRQADCQYLFVNNRMVKDRLLNHAIKTTYQQHLNNIEGTYPSYVLYLIVDPSEVDVNIHPTKQEVRFSHTMLVHDFFRKSIQSALDKISSKVKQIIPCQQSQQRFEKSSAPKKTVLPLLKKFPQEPLRELNIIYENNSRYALIEEQNSVLIVDMEKIKNAFLLECFSKHDPVSSRPLLFPMKVELKNAIQKEILSFLKSLGFCFRSVDEKTFFLLQQPAILKQEFTQEFMVDLLCLVQQEQCKTKCSQYLATKIMQQKIEISLPVLCGFLRQWIASKKKGPWLHLTHAQISDDISD